MHQYDKACWLPCQRYEGTHKKVCEDRVVVLDKGSKGYATGGEINFGESFMIDTQPPVEKAFLTLSNEAP